MHGNSDAARAWVASFGEKHNELRSAVRSRLLLQEKVPVLGLKGDEYPEDVVIEALRSIEPYDANAVRYIARGWLDARKEIDPLLEDPGLDIDEDRSSEGAKAAVVPVFRVAEVTRNPLLSDGVLTALTLASRRSDDSIEAFVLQSVARAGLAYVAETAPTVWERLIIRRVTATLAFRALLALRSQELGEHFAHLMRKTYVDGWRLRLQPLLARAENEGQQESLVEAASIFRERFRHVWDRQLTRADETIQRLAVLEEGLDSGTMLQNVVTKTRADGVPEYWLANTPTDEDIRAVIRECRGQERRTEERSERISRTILTSRNATDFNAREHAHSIFGIFSSDDEIRHPEASNVIDSLVSTQVLGVYFVEEAAKRSYLSNQRWRSNLELSSTGD